LPTAVLKGGEQNGLHEFWCFVGNKNRMPNLLGMAGKYVIL
jgi:hypothetical protein